MTTLEAHGRFASRPDGGASVLPEDFAAANVNGVDPTPALATALCELSGMLPGCQTDAELNKAAEHGVSLVNSGVVSPEQWNQEAIATIQAVLDWGQPQESEMN